MTIPRTLRTAVTCLAVVLVLPQHARAAEDDTPIAVGSRRELFVDQHLIERLDGARRQLHHPVPREVAITHDAPWEGAGSGYHSVIRDGDLYRLYYRGSALGVDNGRLKLGREVYCYAESRDGVTFNKPELGLHEFDSLRFVAR
ncbi:MAG: hypothetical protein J5I93_18755 [Pirellulaceae bacterium]|nr:hypothetical protein [Pirellulaceae bacterium]